MMLYGIFSVLTMMILAVSPMETIDQLIHTTQRSLNQEQQIRLQMQSFLALQDQSIQTPHNKELLHKLTKAASNLLQAIEESHLTHNFSPEFISDLKLLASVANKRGIPAP